MAGRPTEFDGGVFISYRRTLTGHAGHLYGKLKAEFGTRRVFFDERAIPKGATFPDEINAALDKASVILIIVAPQWADHLAERATRSDVDWVLHEVERALKLRKDTPPTDVHVVLVGKAAMPTNLPPSITELSAVNAHRLDSEVLDQDDAQFQELLAYVRAAMPRETSPVDLEDLAKIVCREVLDCLASWKDIREFEALHKRLDDDFDPPVSCKPAQALTRLRTAIEDGRKARRLSREGLGAEKVEALRYDCLVIVGALLRLGACQLVNDGAHVLGDQHTPAAVESLATQCFAVAYQQNGRRASVLFEPGQMTDVGRISVERAVDQKVIHPGIFGDKSSDMVDQLWDLVPEFTGKTKTYPKNPTQREQVRDLATALRQMNDEDRARVTIALHGQCPRESGAQDLRLWLARMDLDVDVLVRTGVSDSSIAEQEKSLILAAWRCLLQIEGIGGDRPKT